jgi:superfamily II DNA or RNA helicase
VNELLENLREACSAPQWNEAVQLARHGAVTGESEQDGEVILRVSKEDGKICYTVSLWPEYPDWTCECPESGEACAHVAAAAIALNKSQKKGESLPSSYRDEAAIAYRFTRSELGLCFQRVLVKGEEDLPFGYSLAALVNGDVDGPSVMATKSDMRVDGVLNYRMRSTAADPTLMRADEAEILLALRESRDVTLDGVSVRCSGDPLKPTAAVTYHPEGAMLILREAQDITEEFINGFVLAGDVLRVRSDGGLSRSELQQLEAGRVYPTAKVPHLMGTVLPQLRKKIDVLVDEKAAPKTIKLTPSIRLETELRGHALSVLATLVYGDPPIARIDGDNLVPLNDGAVPLRNRRAEERVERRLYEKLKLQIGHRENLVDEEAVRFVARLNHWEGPIDGRAHLGFRMLPEIDAAMEFNPENFDLTFTTWGVDEGEEVHRSADPQKVFQAWREGAHLVPLEGGGWAPLPEDWLNQYGMQVYDLLLARGEQEKLPSHTATDVLRLCDDLGVEAPRTMERVRALIDDFDGLPEAELPSGLRAELRPYQEKGFHWLSFLRDRGLGALLADDMGLGKTLQALCSLKGRTLVVAPTSVIYNWLEETQRFRPDLKVCVFHGASRRMDPEADLVLTSYTLMRSEVELLVSETWGTIILDEAQTIKNPDSQVSQAAYRLKSEARFVLTGTPVENRLEELWSLFNFLNRGLLGSLDAFKEGYIDAIANGSEAAVERLRKRIGPFILRRLKRDVAPELPPRTDMVLGCELSVQERAIYDAIRAATQKEVVAQLQAGGNVMKALEALLRLRQASCHPLLVPGQREGESSKLGLLMNRLETLVDEGHKALVFSQWTSLLDLIEPVLEDASIPFLRLDGSTRDRGAVVKSFQGEGGAPVLLISLKAGGTGLNLTAADHVFLMDPWWNPAVEDQAADRAHRIGQDKPVMVYKMMARDTVEEGILSLQLKKRKLAEAALGQGTMSLQITRDDLLELLQ